MIELIRHIEILLLENDCVVVPGFGGFITHYMPASWNAEEKTFSPPIRSIGFNPQLKMNDGILVQSYMEAYDTNFSDATKILEQGVDKLIDALHKEGKVDMANIGEMSLSIHGTYVFSSYDDKVTSPFLYGLDAFEIKDIKALQQLSTGKKPNTQTPEPVNKKIYEIRINRAVARNAVAAVAALVLFFYMSTPIENTYVEKENYAQLLPTSLFGKIEQQSLLTTPIGMNVATNNVATESKATVEPVEAELEAEEQTPAVVSQQTAQPAPKLYHIIIASLAFIEDAQAMVADLKAKGYPDARVLATEKNSRVSIESHSTKEEANRQLNILRKDNRYKNAWLLTR